MPITKTVNSRANIKQLTNADLPINPSQVVTNTYGPVTSTAGQTAIVLSFSVDQSSKSNFFLTIDGKELSEGASNDYEFANVQPDGTSSNITLHQTLPAGLNIKACYLGVVQPVFSLSTLQAQIATLLPRLGVTDGSSAAPGYVGEVISSTASVTSSASIINITSITLTPGDWDMSAMLGCNAQSANTINISISTTSASSAGTTPGLDTIVAAYNSAAGIGAVAISPYQKNITATTTFYLNGYGGPGPGSLYGTIRARRMR